MSRITQTLCRRRRSAQLLSIVLSTLMVPVVLVLSGLSSPEPAFAVPAVNQCNGIDNVGGEALACDVTVVNNLDLATGVTSSTLTTRVCRGAFGVTDLLCTTTPGTFTDLTSSIVQCDGSGNGGGSSVTCTVSVTNNITGDASTSPATVNQCIGSAEGGGASLTCNPSSSTSGATITQCNGSGNGGGATVTCTVGTSTVSAALPVTISQCNGSGSGGGSLVTCTSSITNNILQAAPDTTTPGSGTTLAPGATTPGNTTPRATVPREIPETGTATTIGVLAGALALLAGVAFVLVTRRGRTTHPV
jgi:LPXTG-motif cell wall-anchored protein